MPSIIVTGGAGYIGSHTVIELLNNTSFEVVSLDNFSNSSAKSYERVRQICARPFKTIEVNLCDKEAMEVALDQVNDIIGVIHFAAYKSVPESVADPLLYYQNNNQSLIHILAYCKKKHIQNFIFSSSCSVYGNADSLPVTENTALKKPESPYAHTKQMGEEMIEFFCKANPEFRAVLLRYFNPVGAHMSGLIGEFPVNRPNNLVPIITQTAVGKNTLTVFGNDYPTRDGSCIRDYIHVSDIADAHVKAMDYLLSKKNKHSCSLFNLGTGLGITVLEAIASFEKVSGKKLNYTMGPRRTGDVVAVYANNTRAKEELNWHPQYNIDDMMASAWKWQLNLES